MRLRLLLGIAPAIVLAGLMSPGWAQSVGPLAVEERSSSTAGGAAVSDDALMMLMQQLQQYEQELGSLRGQLDELRHEIEMMKNAERERYLDLDTRLNALTTTPAAAPSTVRPSAPADTAVVDPEQDRTRYMAARDLLYASKFDQARDAFSRYLQDFPAGQFRDFSHFWLGEAYRNQSQPAADKAMAEFRTVVERYPDSSRVPSALYRLAVLQAEQGDKSGARERLQQVISQFPNASEAGYARTMLEQLK